MAEIIKLGTMYFDNIPQKTGVDYDGENFCIGDTIPSKEIQWVKLKNGFLVADRCICACISWDDLSRMGLVYGAAIQIDKKSYLCRCLKVGQGPGQENEWDAALNEVGENNEFWHWKDIFFWGQEKSDGYRNMGITRGFNKPRDWTIEYASCRSEDTGFRPLLEPLIAPPRDYGSLVGRKICVIGPNNKEIAGQLISYTDYDLVLEWSSRFSTGCPWAVRAKNQVVIDRGEIKWLRGK